MYYSVFRFVYAHFIVAIIDSCCMDDKKKKEKNIWIKQYLICSCNTSVVTASVFTWCCALKSSHSYFYTMYLYAATHRCLTPMYTYIFQVNMIVFISHDEKMKSYIFKLISELQVPEQLSSPWSHSVSKTGADPQRLMCDTCARLNERLSGQFSQDCELYLGQNGAKTLLEDFTMCLPPIVLHIKI